MFTVLVFLRSVFVMGSVFAGSVEVVSISIFCVKFVVQGRKTVVIQENESPNRQCIESLMPHFVATVHGWEPSNPKCRLLYRVDIHVSVHHDLIYENDQQDATV